MNPVLCTVLQKKLLLQEKQEEEARRVVASAAIIPPADDEEEDYETEGDISIMTDDNDEDMDDAVTEAGTVYSEYDPVKRAQILQKLQSKTLSALEYQLLDRLNKGDREELLQLKQIGQVRASGILELRERHEEEVSCGEEGGDGTAYFQTLEQLEDIFMKPKEIQSFLKKNATFLLGL